MSEPFIGQIMQVGFSFAPRGWSTCAGQQMSIAQNSAVFALLGTTFGGNGQTTFALPNLQGQMMIGAGTSPSGNNYVAGETGGTTSVTLTQAQMPQHTHMATFASTSSLNASTANGGNRTPAPNNYLGTVVELTAPANNPVIYTPTGTTTVPLSGLNVAGTVTNSIAGGSLPVAIQNPFVAVTTIMALQGIFPSRN